jgi:ribonuclease P protein component
LRKTDDFSSVFRFKCLQRGACLDVYLRPNGQDRARLGMVVGKKALPRAVDRNRVRRRLRESFRLMQAELIGFDAVVRLRVADPGGFSGYGQECAELLRRARAACAHPST